MSGSNLGIKDSEKRYWQVSDEVKKLRKEDHHQKELKVLEEELNLLAQNKHTLLAYYEELLNQHRNEEIKELEEYYESVKSEAIDSHEQMNSLIHSDFIKLSESIFGTFMEVLNERKRVLDKDKDQNTVTSFNRKDQSRNSKDTTLPYTKMLLNSAESPEEILEKLSMHKKKALSKPGERMKQIEIDQDINLIRQHVQYKPEKSRRGYKRQRRERVEKEDVYSEDELPRNDEFSRTNRPRRRARRQEVKDVYSDELSDE
eukprot:NODE_208_length_14728_cov_0.400164.p8 type:complete len:259 gc:universal NODE_208_length_14728_cov_0.400164:11439-10663(-)